MTPFKPAAGEDSEDNMEDRIRNDNVPKVLRTMGTNLITRIKGWIGLVIRQTSYLVTLIEEKLNG